MNQIETTWSLFQPPSGCQIAWMSRRPEIVGGGLDSLAQMRAFADRYRTDSYFTPNPVVPGFGRRPSAVHVAYVTFVCIDIDPVPGAHAPVRLADNRPLGHSIPRLLEGQNTNGTEAIERRVIDHAQDLLGLELNPDRIDSGRGVQIWLRFEPVPVTTQEEKLRWRAAVGTFLHRLDQAVGLVGNCRIDTSVCDIPRAVRLPGTINTKTGRTAQFTHVGEPSAGLYSTLLRRFGVLSPQVSIPRPAGGSWRRSYHLLTWRAKQFLASGAEEPGRHSAAFACARSLAEIGASPEEIERLVLIGASRCSPPLDEWKARRCIRTALERSMDGA